MFVEIKFGHSILMIYYPSSSYYDGQQILKINMSEILEIEWYQAYEDKEFLL